MLDVLLRPPRNMPSKKVTLPDQGIETAIREIRGQNVILDRDLARVYGASTKAFNQTVRRNLARFPADFMFRLSRGEAEAVQISRSQSVTLKRGQNIKYLPYAFTEHGALMAANILRSQRAVQMSVFVIRAFVKMRETFLGTRELTKKLTALEKQLTGRLDSHETAIVHVVRRVIDLIDPPVPPPKPPKPRIGFRP